MSQPNSHEQLFIIDDRSEETAAPQRGIPFNPRMDQIYAAAVRERTVGLAQRSFEDLERELHDERQGTEDLWTEGEIVTLAHHNDPQVELA